MNSAWGRGVLGLAICHLIFVLGFLGTRLAELKVRELTAQERIVNEKSRQAVSKRDSNALRLANDELEGIYHKMVPIRNWVMSIAGTVFLASVVHVWVVWQLTSESVSRWETAARASSFLIPCLIALRFIDPKSDSLEHLDTLASVLVMSGVYTAIAKICLQTGNREIAITLRKIIGLASIVYISTAIPHCRLHEFIERIFPAVFLLCTVWYCATLVKLWRRI